MFIGCSTCCGGDCTPKQYIIGYKHCYNGASGAYGVDTRTYTYPSESGTIMFYYNAYTIPDKFTIFMGDEIITTGYVGSAGYGVPVEGPGLGCLMLQKPAGITEITAEVEATLYGTGWDYSLSCLVNDFQQKEYNFLTGKYAGEMRISIGIDIYDQYYSYCQDENGVQATVFVRVVDANNQANLIAEGNATVSDQESLILDFFKPYGITNVIIYVSVYNLPANQHLLMNITCPKVIDPPEPPPEEDSTDGNLIDPDSDNDRFVRRDPPIHNNGEDGDGGGVGGGNGRFIGGTRPPPNNGGFNGGGVNSGCTNITFTNGNEPICYGIYGYGLYISNDPDEYVYIDADYPSEAGTIIAKFNSFKSEDPNKQTPIRAISIWGITNTNNFVSLLPENTLVPLEDGEDFCFSIEKPVNIRKVRVYIREDNPDLARVKIEIALSCLIDENDFEIKDRNNIYDDRIYNIGNVGGIVNFYASLQMVEDEFLDCLNLSSLPIARFIVSDPDDNDSIKLDFTLTPENPGVRLNPDNTFVDKISEFFKSVTMRRVRVRVQYTRNAYFRWTLGCPRVNCFSLCGRNQDLADLPKSIIVNIEAEDYYFKFNILGCGIWKYKDRDTYANFALGFDPNFGLPAQNRPYEFVKNVEFSAIWGVPGDVYNGDFTLDLDESGTYYEYVFDKQFTCPNSNNPSSIRLQTDGASCSVWLNNLKCFWKIGSPAFAANLNQVNCESEINIYTQVFNGYSCRSDSFAVSCNNLYDAQPLNAPIPFLKPGLQSFYDYVFDGIIFDKWRKAGLSTALFGTIICDFDTFDRSNAGQEPNILLRPPFPLIRGSNEYDRYRNERGLLLGYTTGQVIYEEGDYNLENPRFELPDYNFVEGDGLMGKFRNITKESGKPYMVIKSVRSGGA